MKVFRDTDGDGDSSTRATRTSAARSRARPTSSRRRSRTRSPAQTYVVRMTNFAAVEPYEGTVTYAGRRSGGREGDLDAHLRADGGRGAVGAAGRDRARSGEDGRPGRLRGACSGGTTGGGTTGGGTTGGGTTGGGIDGGTTPGAQGPNKRDKPRVRPRMTLTFDGRFYTARITGSLLNTDDRAKVNAAGAGTNAQRCAGTVTIAIKSGKRLVVSRRAG